MCVYVREDEQGKGKVRRMLNTPCTHNSLLLYFSECCFMNMNFCGTSTRFIIAFFNRGIKIFLSSFELYIVCQY